MAKVTEKQIEKLIADKIDGTFYCDLEGNELFLKVKKGGEAVVIGTEDNDEPTVLQEDEYVCFTINDDVRKFITKYLDKLYGYRGLKNPDDIDENDPEVKDLIERALRKKIAEEKISRRRAKLPRNQIIAIINRVARRYKPQAQLAITQLILLAIIFNDVIRVENGNIVIKFDDLEIDEAYWGGASSNNALDELDKLLGDEDDSIFIDSTNKLEILIAYSVSFYSMYPEVGGFIADKKILERLAESISIKQDGTSYDDIGFLQNRVDELLR